MQKGPLPLDADLIARAHPDLVADDETALRLLTDAELAPGLERMLAEHPPGGDLWVFGYGSLIWKPEFEVAESRVGTVRGWHRRFCLLQRRFRGTPERPGLVLALDRGGICRGVAFRLKGPDPVGTLMPVWRREMRGLGYEGRWLDVATEEGPVRALSFVVNRAGDRYTGRLTDPQAAALIAAACGHLGPSADYLFRTVEACRALGIRDRHLEAVSAHVAAQLAERLRTRAAALR